MMQVPDKVLDMSTQRKKRAPLEQGNTGRIVAQNLARIRSEAGMTAEELVNKMAEAGHKMPRTAISDMEHGYRRVTVDDLIALAIALKVNPNTLLLPNYDGDDLEMSDELTTAAKGTTGADIWAWGDGWNALPQHRLDAPEVDPSATGMERGYQLAKHRRVADGLDFLARIRPGSEEPSSREFLLAVREQTKKLQENEWLSLWWHSNESEPLSSRVAAWPEEAWTDITEFFDRMTREIEGINQSPDARYAMQAKKEDR